MLETIQIKNTVKDKIQSIKEMYGLSDESQVIEYLYNVFLNASISRTLTVENHNRFLNKVKSQP